jgi:hypothetical protein
VTGDSVTAPMQATIVKVAVSEGEVVVKGDLVVVLEAMKMEHVHKAGIDGMVGAIDVAEGEQVTTGQDPGRDCGAVVKPDHPCADSCRLSSATRRLV